MSNECVLHGDEMTVCAGIGSPQGFDAEVDPDASRPVVQLFNFCRKFDEEHDLKTRVRGRRGEGGGSVQRRDGRERRRWKEKWKLICWRLSGSTMGPVS